VVLCLFSVLFLGVADSQIVSPLLPAIREQFQRSSAEMGFLFTAYALSAALSGLVWGPLSDTFGRRRCLIAGLILFSAGSSVSYLSASYNWLLAGRVLTGMGASMISLNTISYAADYFPYTTRGRAMGMIFSSYYAAFILGVPLGSLAGDTLGWNAVFLISAGLGLFLAASIPWFLVPQPVAPGSAGFSERFLNRQVNTYLGFLRGKATLGALFSSLLASAGMMGFLAFVGVWLHDAFAISGKQLGLVFIPPGAVALLVSPVGGALSDKLGKRFQFVLSNLALAALLLVLPWMRWGVTLFVVLCGISLASSFRQAPMEALLTEVVHPGLRGSFVALKNSFSQLGIGMAALLSGALYESGGYSWVCLFCAALNLLAAVSMLTLVRGKNL
jgi:predicted MFS family arabinose efflux permease